MNIIGLWTYREPFTPVKVFSALLALVGIYLVFSFSLTSFTVLAAAMAILNGVASGGEVAFSKKLSTDYSPLFVVIMSWAIILVTNAITSVVLKETQHIPTLTLPWLWQLCYSGASLFGFWLVIAGFKYVDASIGALIGLLEIIFSILFGVIVFREVITPTIIIGGACIIAAASLPHLYELVRRRRSGLLTINN